MADLMSGPNAPLTRAFIFCEWRCITIDWLINPQHDLANPDFQQELHEMLQQADCICAALDCSTKSRGREIPRRFEDGRPAPKPLRSDEYPTGLPHLRGRDLRRVTRDNQACDFVLQEIQELSDRGGASLRENPARSLRWELPREKLAFAIAVSTSWWAVRAGRAKLRVPRMPPTESVGRRELPWRSSWGSDPSIPVSVLEFPE